MIFVRSTIMNESLKCEGSGGLRDLILQSDRGVQLHRNAACLWPSLLIGRVLIDLLCELHTSNSWRLFYHQHHHVLCDQKWHHTRLTVDLLNTAWDRHRAHFVRSASTWQKSGLSYFKGRHKKGYRGKFTRPHCQLKQLTKAGFVCKTHMYVCSSAWF